MTPESEARTIYAPPNVQPPLPEHRTLYKYNLDGQIVRITRPDGVAINFSYDLLNGQIASYSTPAGQTTFNYDIVDGRLDRITAPDGGTIEYQYNGELVTQESWAGTVVGAIDNTYDDAFRLSKQTVNGASTLVVDYDQDSTPQTGTLYDDPTLTTQVAQVALTLDPTNSRTVVGSSVGQASESFEFNSLGDVTRITASFGGTTLLGLQYGRDLSGRVESILEQIEGSSRTFDYEYDTSNRLFRVSEDSSLVAEYLYDQNANRNGGFSTRPSSAGGCSTYVGTVDAQDRLTSSTCGGLVSSFSYTANGELLQRDDAGVVTDYTYDEFGALRSVSLPDGRLIEYVIDGRNRRVGKKVDGTLVQSFLYGDHITPVAELDGTGSVVGHFVYLSRASVPDLVVRGQSVFRIFADELGSPRLVIDIANGTVVQRTDYDEFGNIVFEQVDPGFLRLPFGFAGGLYDEDTNLVRFGARDYDPKVGRWTAKDPMGFSAGDTNLYAYVLSDPLNLTDPLGLQTLSEQSFQTKLQGALRGNQPITFRLRQKAKCVAIDIITQDAVDFGIYLFMDMAAGLPYVGQSTQLATRLQRHRSAERLTSFAHKFKISGSISLNEAENFILDQVLSAQGGTRRDVVRQGGSVVANKVSPPGYDSYWQKKNLKFCK